MKFHDDGYLWETICIVVGPREDVYEKLEGKMWTIQMIEDLAKAN